MNHYLAFVWGVCFSLIAGGAFALMWSNVRDINKMMSKPSKPLSKINSVNIIS